MPESCVGGAYARSVDACRREVCVDASQCVSLDHVPSGSGGPGVPRLVMIVSSSAGATTTLTLPKVPSLSMDGCIPGSKQKGLAHRGGTFQAMQSGKPWS